MPQPERNRSGNPPSSQWWQRDVTRLSLILSASVCSLISVWLLIQVGLFGLARLEAPSTDWLAGATQFARNRVASGGGPGLGFAIFPFLSWLLWWSVPPKN